MTDKTGRPEKEPVAWRYRPKASEPCGVWAYRDSLDVPPNPEIWDAQPLYGPALLAYVEKLEARVLFWKSQAEDHRRDLTDLSERLGHTEVSRAGAEARVAALNLALREFSGLEIPEGVVGNAGMYLISFDDIRQARTALNTEAGRG